MIGKHISVVENGLMAVIQLEIVKQPLIGTVQNDLVVIVVLIAEGQLHGHGGKQDGRHPAGGVPIVQSTPLQISFRAAQAEYNVVLIQAVGILRHGNMQDRVQFHPFTPPAVSPEVMCFWHRKKITSTGRDTVMEAAANTGQLPLISVA